MNRNTMYSIDVPSTLPVIAISYSHYLDTMTSERWKNDIAYAMTPFKLLTWHIGVWPLQVYNVFSLIRCIFATCCLVCIFWIWRQWSLSCDNMRTYVKQSVLHHVNLKKILILQTLEPLNDRRSIIDSI